MLSEQLERFRLDKEKYTRIAQSEGLSAALTTLHADQRELEFTTFEGEDGWQPKLWEILEEYRAFSRELWQLELDTRLTKPVDTGEAALR